MPRPARWIKPVLTQPDIRRETARMLRAVFADKRLLLRAAESLPAFDRPALVVWAAGDRVMPPEHGRRLATLLPNAGDRSPQAWVGAAPQRHHRRYRAFLDQVRAHSDVSFALVVKLLDAEIHRSADAEAALAGGSGTTSR
jgi:pimeloyl-ACP methyl ester carboxylesterase